MLAIWRICIVLIEIGGIIITWSCSIFGRSIWQPIRKARLVCFQCFPRSFQKKAPPHVVATLWVAPPSQDPPALLLALLLCLPVPNSVSHSPSASAMETSASRWASRNECLRILEKYGKIDLSSTFTVNDCYLVFKPETENISVELGKWQKHDKNRKKIKAILGRIPLLFTSFWGWPTVGKGR